MRLSPEEISRLLAEGQDFRSQSFMVYGSKLALAFHIGDLVQVLSGKGLQRLQLLDGCWLNTCYELYLELHVLAEV